MQILLSIRCKPLLLPIVAKSSILNVAEFLDPSLKKSPCTKTSLVLRENYVPVENFVPVLAMISLFGLSFLLFA